MDGTRRGDTLESGEEHWIPLSDLMTGLMMFFLLLALAYMVKVEADGKKIREIAVLYDQMRNDLYADLKAEFKNDLPRWGAELDQKDLAIRFKEPDVLFDTNKHDLKSRFRDILNDFIPRYVRILTSPKYRESIQEVRIEGHTSSIWGATTNSEDAYLRNMELSQARTRSTLQYVLGIAAIEAEKTWLRKYLTANGLSSSKLILNIDGSENLTKSQRVEFRVRTDADARIARIIEQAQ